MDAKKDGHSGKTVTCPSCKGPFWQRLDGRPRTCSRSCSRKLEWISRPRKQRVAQSDGYILRYAPGRPDGIGTGRCYILEHRLVMERKLGRRLERHERVHHKNGDRADNRLKRGHESKGCPPSCCNLELWKVKTKDPPGVRASDYHCAGCRCGK